MHVSRFAVKRFPELQFHGKLKFPWSDSSTANKM